MAEAKESEKTEKINFQDFKNEVLADYKLACISREASLLGRKEVLSGKAKFGIFGDGKELAQIAMAKQFRNGDWRSGYYRDQTFMMAIGELNVQQYFAALYAHTDLEHEPTSGGRQMGGHYATRFVNPDGSLKPFTQMKNSSADISPTAGQMPRLLGLAQASKVFKNNPELKAFTDLSNEGNEVAFGTIGDASTSEGLFFETINAAGVLQVPMAMSVWDDGWGISVSKKYQTTKESISELLKGLQREKDGKLGYEIFNVKGWDYPSLIDAYENAVKVCREEHVPVLIHVEEVTQPQGHSTSGSHERYKSKEILEWTIEYDCINQFKKWILEFGEKTGSPIATEEKLESISEEAKKHVREEKSKAWKAFLEPIKAELNACLALLDALAGESKQNEKILALRKELASAMDPIRKDIIGAARKALRITKEENGNAKRNLSIWVKKQIELNFERYSSHLYSESPKSPLKIKEVKPVYGSDNRMEDGRVILRENFKAQFAKNPLILTFGEDTGKIGGVNQSMEGMQELYGEIRVSDTGIREATILGQGIGLAMRGLRPIAEIQYLDYILYCLQIMSDDLATIQYRTKGGQRAPLIVRTRGHRLEGIWHSGSPMAGILNLIRGIHVCVPRNMTKSAGFYNTLLDGDDPGLVIDCLNGYRTKEPFPTNLSEIRTPLGVPEIVKEGTDLTIISYGSTFNLCSAAVDQLNEAGISVELIDVQTLIPFDINGIIVESLKKTNRVLFVDEDVPGGTTAYMMDKVLNEQGGYYYLDSAPKCLAAKEHRPPYGTDGDYFSKPSIDDIFETAYEIMHETAPAKYPHMY
ncbi:MAG: thiamine pyrophosphate-dependent enzyme [Flavobacteriales bacterium]